MKRGLFALRMQKTWSDHRNLEKISRELFGVRVQIFGWFIFRLVVKERECCRVCGMPENIWGLFIGSGGR